MMDPMLRFCLALTLGLVAYGLYWWGIGRIYRVRFTKTANSPAELALRSGFKGYLRLYGGWLVALTVVACIIESDGVPLTAEWWREALFGGDWVFVVLAPNVLAYAAWRRVPRRVAPVSQPRSSIKHRSEGRAPGQDC